MYNPATNPNHAAGLAAERVLLASATLLRNTIRCKPIQAGRHVKRMLRELPILLTALGSDAIASLETQIELLGNAYETGSASAAASATASIEEELKSLCH